MKCMKMINNEHYYIQDWLKKKIDIIKNIYTPYWKEI